MDLELLKTPIDIERLKMLLPHRFPFLLIDRVIELSGGSEESREGRKAVAIKNITYNEPQFTGHFPHQSVMPGVLMIEAMAQTCVLTAYNKKYAGEKYNFFIASVKEAKFRRLVIPGDTLVMTALMMRDRGSMMSFNVVAKVENEIAASCEILAKMVLA